MSLSSAEELLKPMNDTVFEYPLDLIVMTDAHYYSPKLGIDTPSYKKYDSTNQKAVKDSPAIISAAMRPATATMTAMLSLSSCSTH